MQQFIQLIAEHKKNLSDFTLHRLLSEMLTAISTRYKKILDAIEQEVSETDEVFSRELLGAKSAYSLSVGDTDKLAQLIDARELQKRDVDQQVRKVLEDIHKAAKEIESYLKMEKMGGYQLFRQKVVVDQWYTIGNNQFKQTKSGRWMTRQVGAGTAPGVFASKKELEQSGILHYELLRWLTAFEQHVQSLTDYIWQRMSLTKQILGHAGYMLHKIQHSLEKTKADVRRNLSGDNKLLIDLNLIERKEEETVNKAEKQAIAYGQHTILNVRAARSRFRTAIAAGLAGLMTAAAVGRTAESIQTKVVPHAITTAPQREVVIGDVVEQQIKIHVTKDLVVTNNFPFDVSNQTVDAAKDIKDAFPDILKAVIAAAKQAGYDKYQDFIKDTHFYLEIQLSGFADPTGSSRYNLKLSDKRARFIEQKLAAFSEQSGIPMVMTKLKASGETGEPQILATVQKLLRKASTGDPIINNIRAHLDTEGNRTLKYWWKWANKYKDAKRKEFAINNLLHAVHRIAALDALLLAPHRKAVLQVQFEYDVKGTGPESIAKVILVDNDEPPEMFSAPQIFSEKAMLTGTEFPYFKTAEPVQEPKFGGPGGYQRFNIRKGRYMQRGPMGKA